MAQNIYPVTDNLFTCMNLLSVWPHTQQQNILWLRGIAMACCVCKEPGQASCSSAALESSKTCDVALSRLTTMVCILQVKVR